MADTNRTETISADAITARVMDLNERRTSTVQALAQCALEMQNAQRALDEARQQYNAAWKQAQREGRWKEEELTRDLGLPKPDAAPRQRRARRTAEAKTQPESQ